MAQKRTLAVRRVGIFRCSFRATCQLRVRVANESETVVVVVGALVDGSVFPLKRKMSENPLGNRLDSTSLTVSVRERVTVCSIGLWRRATSTGSSSLISNWM